MLVLTSAGNPSSASRSPPPPPTSTSRKHSSPPFQLLPLSLLLLLLTLTLSTLTPSAHAVGAPDPTCKRGLKNKGACCQKRCTRCGGAGCALRGKRLGTKCCPSGITGASSSVASCRKTGPPCRLGGGGGPTTPPPADTTKGWFRYANVVSGSLSTRHEACAVMVNGLVVLVGGRGVNKETNIYNPKTRVWTSAPGPGGGIEIHHFQCVAAGGKVWIVSSWTGGYPFEKNNNKVFVFDVPTRKWSTRPGMPAARNRGGGAAVLKGDIIYVVAGNRGGHGSHATSLGWMDAFNWRTGKWLTRKFASLPAGAERDHVGGALVKGQLCIAGGRDGGRDDFFNAVVRSTYCYSFSGNKWFKKKDFPQGRAGAATATACDGRMMVAGGEGNGVAYKRVDVFDGSTWKRGPSLKHERHGSGIAVAKCSCGRLFIPSGSGRQGGGPELSTTEEYLPAKAKGLCSAY